MIIHVVTSTDTIYSIAEQYGVNAERLILENDLTNPDQLVVGQTIVVQVPTQTHTVSLGETLFTIAEQYGVTVFSLLQNNPYLSTKEYLTAGETIVITYDNEKLRDIDTNGYVYPFVNETVLTRTLPYLTYITIFTYGFTPEGELIPLDDEPIINRALEFGVQPLMHISTLSDNGTFNDELANQIFENDTARANLIDNILANLQAKNYAGVDVDFEFIKPSDALAYANFITELTTRVNEYGLITVVALAPKTSRDQPGVLYEGHLYEELGAAANNVLLMTYEWGYTYGPPMAVAPINKVREVLDYAVTAIEPNNIYLGIPNYAYDWPLPYVKGQTAARSLGNVAAVELARQYNVAIQYDTTAQTPFFYYTAIDGVEHVVWFEDARSIDAKVRLVPEYNFQGITYWNLMKFFPQNWLVVNALFNIRKL